MIASPTGTGYVNYAAVAILEFLTRGDCATIAMQYSARPSPLSLDRVGEGRLHARLLMRGDRATACAQCPPEQRPEGRAVRREPRRVDEPGRIRRSGNAGPRRRRHRLRDLDRHAALQPVEGTVLLRRPPRRRPRARSACSTTSASGKRSTPSSARTHPLRHDHALRRRRRGVRPRARDPGARVARRPGRRGTRRFPRACGGCRSRRSSRCSST